MVRKVDKKKSLAVIFNFDNDLRSIYHGVIAHEAVHAAHISLDSVGQLPDFNNDEVVAYLVEYITDEIYKFAKEKKLKVATI